MLKELAPGERRDAVIREVQAQVARVMGLDETELPDPEQGFFQMGLDSLMAIELKNYLGLSLGRTVPATIMFQFSNIAGLSEYLLREAIPATEGIATRPEANGTPKEAAPEPSGNESTRNCSLCWPRRWPAWSRVKGGREGLMNAGPAGDRNEILKQALSGIRVSDPSSKASNTNTRNQSPLWA